MFCILNSGPWSQRLDCSGIWGYAGFLEAIHDPQHPEHGEMLE
jgi:hypothetical protein